MSEFDFEETLLLFILQINLFPHICLNQLHIIRVFEATTRVPLNRFLRRGRLHRTSTFLRIKFFTILDAHVGIHV